MRTKKLLQIAVPAIAATLLACGDAHGNLVTNGGFETYTGSAPKDFFNNVKPTDWASSAYAFIDAPGTADDLYAPGVPVYGPFPATSPDGGNFLQSDGSPGLAQPITQTISVGLVVGQSYNLSFYQAAGQQYGDSGATTEQWQVSLGSQTQTSALMSIPQGGVWNWEPQSMNFTATASSEALSFLAIGGGGGVPPMVFLDGVDLESTVPEPSAFMLLGGVGGCLALGRLHRRIRATRNAPPG